MRRWIFRFEPDEDGSSLWRWEEWNDSALIQQSSASFGEWAECVEDARKHGYTGEPGAAPPEPSAS